MMDDDARALLGQLSDQKRMLTAKNAMPED